MRKGKERSSQRRRRRLDGEDDSPASTTTTDEASQSCPSSTSTNLDPSSFGYYDAIYDHVKSADFAKTSRVGSVEVVPPINNENGSNIETDQTYAILRFITINALTSTSVVNGTKTLVPRGNGGTQIYGDLSGIMLGIHHFNNGIGSVVSEVTNIHQSCPIRFALDDFNDSESSQTVAVQHFGKTIIDDPNRPPSGVFGAWRSSVSIPLATVSGAYGVPQVSPLSTSTELDKKSVYRYFSRLIPSDAGTAKAVMDYLTRPEIGVRHLGMLYANDAYGSAFHLAIHDAGFASRSDDERVLVRGNPYSYSDDVKETARNINLQVEQLALTGYRYFFGVFYDEHYEMVMNAAYRHGIAGPGYVWIVSDGLSDTYLDGRVYQPGTPLAIASQGIGILKAEGGRETVDGNSGYDRFIRAWYQQGADNVDYYNCKQPKNNTINDPSIYFKGPSDFFTGKQLAPTAGAVFTYDSAIAMGLAACELYEEKGDDYFNGEELFDRFVSQTFEGASGNVKIDPKTASRDPKSAFFVLYNANGEPDGEGGTIFSVKTVAHSASGNSNEESTNVEWVSYQDEVYLYSDGTADPPAPLPPVNEDLNQLSTGFRVAGLVLAGIIFVLAIFFGLWTKKNCNKRVVKASQPQFLYMICAGVSVLGSTIIPLSIDDGIATVDGCNIACMSIPWLFNYGFTAVFSALFAKTWRLNKVMENAAKIGQRKMKVTIRDALRPFFVLVILNTIILVVWTKVDPLVWTRIDTGSVDSFGRSIDSYGTCSSNNIVPYVVLLFVINFGLLVLANYQAYKSRKLSTEFSESRFISIIMASIFQAVVIGLPLSILVSKDPNAFFLVVTCIISAMCLSTLCFMFVPKMKRKVEQPPELPADDQQQQQQEQENQNIGETAVRRAGITQIKVDLGSEANDEEDGGAASGGGGGGGMLVNWWGAAKELYHGPGNPAIDNDEEESGDDDVIKSKSIFVGTLLPSKSGDSWK